MTLLLTACTQNAPPPTTAPSPPQADDSSEPFPPAELRRALRACDAPDSASAVEAEYGVRVDTNGKVTVVKALKSTLPPAMLNCTLARIRDWAFPTSKHGAAFRFTMTFEPSQQRPVEAGKAELKATIKHRTSALQHCYNEALRKDVTQFGKVDYAIVIAVDGSVTSADAEVGPYANLSSALVDCTLAKIEGWRFPMGEAEVEASVSFSVVFSEEGPPEGDRQHGDTGGPAMP